MSSPLSNLLSVIGPLIANQALATLALFLFLQSARLVTSQNLQMFCLSVPVYSRGKLLLMFYFTSSLKFHIFFVHLVHYWSPINKLPLFFNPTSTSKTKASGGYTKGHNYNLKPRKTKECQRYFENWMYTKTVYLQNCEELSKKKLPSKMVFKWTKNKTVTGDNSWEN